MLARFLKSFRYVVVLVGLGMSRTSLLLPTDFDPRRAPFYLWSTSFHQLIERHRQIVVPKRLYQVDLAGHSRAGSRIEYPLLLEFPLICLRAARRSFVRHGFSSFNRPCKLTSNLSTAAAQDLRMDSQVKDIDAQIEKLQALKLSINDTINSPSKVKKLKEARTSFNLKTPKGTKG